MSWGYYVSGQFLFIATTNLFNAIAFLSALLLLLDPALFVAHTFYNFYAVQPVSTQANRKRRRGSSEGQQSRPDPQNRLTAKIQWWKWYGASAVIHLLDAWFFRSIIPFFERARSQLDSPADDLQDLADICRLLWGIVRALSVFVVALEVWEKRLVLKTVLGQDYMNPKWGFAISYFIAPAIVAISALPVGVYFILIALWKSVGFFWDVVGEAFTPDWRSSQDVFVKTPTDIAVAPTASVTVPAWKFWVQN